MNNEIAQSPPAQPFSVGVWGWPAATLQKVVSCCPCLLSSLFFPSGLWRSELSVPRSGLHGAVSAPERLPAPQQGRGCKNSRLHPGVSHTGVPRPGSSHGTRGCATARQLAWHTRVCHGLTWGTRAAASALRCPRTPVCRDTGLT